MQARIQKAVEEAGSVLLGKQNEIRLALCCLLAGGHLLIEDLPGMGKTTLAQALSRIFGLDYNRIQFTSDLLPADILGVSIFDPRSGAFSFHPGPIFSQLVLADEINRATPKTQSALLEAMEEAQVTVEGATRALPQPFFVIATQNPITLAGTFPLPESQLDRFLMRLQLGYPDPQAERQLLESEGQRERALHVQSCITHQDLIEFRATAGKVTTSAMLLDYVQRLIACTRDATQFHCGLSPRGSLALIRAAKTWARMEGRGHVIPEDVQAVFAAVAEHRLQPLRDGRGVGSASLSKHILNTVDVFRD
jgi:MoxR-like ATPase